MNETRVELAAELVCSQSHIINYLQITSLFPPIKSSNPWSYSQKRLISLLLTSVPIFSSPFTHMVHHSSLFPLSFLINILKCFCQENFSYKVSKHAISLQKAMTVKKFLKQTLNKSSSQMVKHNIFEINLNNHLIQKWNDFELFKMGLAV